jgi:hypothetical protein
MWSLAGNTTTALLSDVELLLRVGCFGIFWGHGYLAATKREFGSWEKFTRAGGFTPAEAQIIMPLVGCMDLALAVLTLVHPVPLFTTWMVSWAFSTALVRPISGGHIWGFVERAGNFVCPLALLRLQTGGGSAAWRLRGAAFDALDAALAVPGWGWREHVELAAVCVVLVWCVIAPAMRMRKVHTGKWEFKLKLW